MGLELKNLDFEEWILHIFDHATDGLQWYHDIDADWWDETKLPQTAISYWTRLCHEIEAIAKDYTDAQLDQGLYYLISDYGHLLTDTRVSFEEREGCVRAWYEIFENLYVEKCTPTLSHLDEPNSNLLNTTCYMWWDVLPLYGENHGGLADGILHLMEKTLALPHDACRESALHGLGHWQMYFKKRVVGIIDSFLKQNAAIRPALGSYAANARTGCVL